MKKLLKVLGILLLVSTMFACSGGGAEVTPDPKKDLKEIDSGTGFKIWADKNINKEDMEGYDLFAYEDDCAFSVLREDFTLLEEYELADADTTLEEYAEIIGEANGISLAKDKYGELSATYTAESEGNNFWYYSVVRKGSESFWLVSFFCLAEDQATYEDQFGLWASTIETE